MPYVRYRERSIYSQKDKHVFSYTLVYIKQMTPGVMAKFDVRVMIDITFVEIYI
jgi:hypothetical protein